jgi:hypothetical protein
MSDDSAAGAPSRGAGDGDPPAGDGDHPPQQTAARRADPRGLTLTPEEQQLTAEKEAIIARQREEIKGLEAISAELSSLLADMVPRRQAQTALERGVSELRPEARKRSIEREVRLKASSVIGEAKAAESTTRIWEGRQLNDAAAFRKSAMDDIAIMRGTVGAVEQSLRPGPAPVSSPDGQPSPAPQPPDLIERLEDLAGQARDDDLVASGTAVQRCPYKSGRKLDGIIAWMAAKFGGNPAAKNEIEVTASGCLQPARFGPVNACDLGGASAFVSANQPDQWICYDFKHRRVRLTHYSIRSRFDGFKGSNNPKSWVVEGSATGESWVTLDVQKDNSEINDKDVTAVWRIHEADDVKLVRLRLTTANHSGKHYLAMSGFELFGSISNV